jgi:hypothetical protein
MMHRRSPEGFEFTPEHERVLRDLTIDESGPGTVLHDFDAFLTFIKEQELSVTPMHQLRRRVLPEINARLARPLQLGLKKPLQKSYPHIHGLYLLVRASGLTCIEETPKKPLLVVDDEVYQVWKGLNPTERYCTLLETWLLRGHPEIINERAGFPGGDARFQGLAVALVAPHRDSGGSYPRRVGVRHPGRR